MDLKRSHNININVNEENVSEIAWIHKHQAGNDVHFEYVGKTE